MKDIIELKLTKQQADLLFETLAQGRHCRPLMDGLFDEIGRPSLDLNEELGEIQQQLIRAGMDEDVVAAAEAWRPELKDPEFRTCVTPGDPDEDPD